MRENKTTNNSSEEINVSNLRIDFELKLLEIK